MALARRAPTATLLVIPLVALLAACSATQASELGATCDEFGRTPTIQQSAELAIGQDLSVTLCSNPSTGFSWEQASVGDPAVVGLVSQAYSAPDAASLPVVGRAGGEVVKLHAVGPGETTIRLGYSRPWEVGTTDEWTYELAVTVR